MREVIFEKDAKIYYRNRYGKIEHIASLQANKAHFIPTTDKYIRAFIDNCKQVFIYEGEGTLPLSEVQKYDFKNLDTTYLDFYMQEGHFHSKISFKQRKLIKEFCEVYENNEELSYTIYPPFYEEKLREVLGMGRA